MLSNMPAIRVFVQLMPFNSEDKVFSIEIRNDGFMIPYEKKRRYSSLFIG